MNEKIFLKVVTTTKPATEDEIIQKLDKARYWDAEFNADALLSKKRAHVRKQMRKHKGEKGLPLFAAIISTGEGGKKKRVYKQEVLFDLEDYQVVIDQYVAAGERHNRKTQEVVNRHVSKRERHFKLAAQYRERAFERFQVQIPLPFDFEEDK